MAQDGAFDEDWFELFGARGDGRGLDAPRRLDVKLGTARSRHVDGSCDVAQGLTRVSAHAQGPREHERRSDEKHDRCVLEVAATYAPFASVGARTGARRQDGRDLENAVRNALTPALMAELLQLREAGAAEPAPTASAELVEYFAGAFGNETRIDYGTGHELSLLVWLHGLRQLGLLEAADSPSGRGGGPLAARARRVCACVAVCACV